MKVSYKGMQQALPDKLQKKLDARFTKVGKLLERRGEKEARVIVTQERHLYHAEITLPFYDHDLVCIGSDGDVFNALTEALEKLEKQAVKQRAKWREKARRGESPKETSAKTVASAPPASAKGSRETSPKIFRVNHHERRKPITLDEALLQMEDGRDYFVYRDAEKESVVTLVRRRDGHYDLIES